MDLPINIIIRLLIKRERGVLWWVILKKRDEIKEEV